MFQSQDSIIFKKILLKGHLENVFIRFWLMKFGKSDHYEITLFWKKMSEIARFKIWMPLWSIGWKFGWTFRVKFVDLTRSNFVNNISVVHVMVPIIAPLFEFRPNLANFVTCQATNFHHVLKQCFSISITIYFPDKSCDNYGKQCFFYPHWW